MLLRLAAEAAPPRHFPVGADAIEWLQKKNAAVQADIDQWRDLSTATAFPNPESDATHDAG